MGGIEKQNVRGAGYVGELLRHERRVLAATHGVIPTYSSTNPIQPQQRRRPHGQSPIGDVECIDKEHVQENYETVDNIYGDVQT